MRYELKAEDDPAGIVSVPVIVNGDVELFEQLIIYLKKFFPAFAVELSAAALPGSGG